LSATGRNIEGHERSLTDFYRTPAWATKSLWRRLAPELEGRIGLTYIDAGAGDGAISEALAACGVAPSQIMMVENDPTRTMGTGTALVPASMRTCGDYLETTCFPNERACRVVVMNPPFDQAGEFIRHSLANCPRVAALLRLGFLETPSRSTFHREHPADLLVFPSRPSFAYGKTDSTPYAWFLWGFGKPGACQPYPDEEPARLGGGRWEILDVGDKEWRKANP
jgi:hypothetical protein